MPARVIRAEINRSASLARVSVLADLFFRALLLECDDFGRFDARPQILKGVLFPLRAEYTIEVVEQCLEELASGDDPALRVYHVASRPYLLLTGWERHRGRSRRADRSKYPDPPRESGESEEFPRISREIRGTPGYPRKSARLTSDVCRLTSDVCRLTSDEGSAEGGAPAAPAAAAPLSVRQQPEAAATDCGPERAPKPPPAAWAAAAAGDLRAAVLRRWPRAAVPDSLVTWAREIERVDATPEDVAELLAWLVDPLRDAERYVPEVRCARSFRAKWNALVAAHARSCRAPPKSGAQQRYERILDAGRGALELLKDL